MPSPTASPTPTWPVTLLVASLERDGAETQLVLLAKRLAAWGWPVQLVAMLPIDAFGSELDGLEVHFLGMGRRAFDPAAALRFVRLLRRHRSRALVSFTSPANLFGRLVGRAAGAPVIVSSIRGERVGGRAKELAMRLTARFDSVTTTNSERVAASLARRGLAGGRQLQVIPNGVDLRRFTGRPEVRGQTRSELGADDATFVWLAVGRLEPAKDYPTLLAALARLGAAPAHRLYVAGGGSLRSELEARAETLGVAERVRFLGARSDVPRLLAAADAVVLSSAHEGMPNALMEAGAAARPAVATDVGGVREVLRDGEGGLVVPPGDPEALAEGMRRLMAMGPLERARLGDAARHHITAGYSVDAMARSWQALLTERLEARGRR